MEEIKTMNYEQYLKGAKEEELIFIEELDKQGVLLEEGLKKIEDIKEDVDVLVITSTHCKDSAAILPYLIKFSNINSKIKINILLKAENEELLQELSKECTVPTFLILDKEKKVIRKFVEFPKGVKNILIANPKEKTQEIIYDLRMGKYNSLIQEDLIAFIIGESYEYISFKRKDI